MAHKVMTLRRDDTCAGCGAPQPAGTRAQWDSGERVVRCLPCAGADDVAAPNEALEAPPPTPPDAAPPPTPPDAAPPPTPPDAAPPPTPPDAAPPPTPPDAAPPPTAAVVDHTPEPAAKRDTPPGDEPIPDPVEPLGFDGIDTGVAGASARAEYERRREKRLAGVEERWGTGRLGRVAKALSSDPQHTIAWAQGARGEERLANTLTERVGDRAIALHDRKVPRTRGNIDHIVVASTGVWVVDAKRYLGKVECRDVGGWFKTDIRLYVNGRDRTKAVKGTDWQIEAVKKALDDESIPVQAAIALVGSQWGLFQKPFRVSGVLVAHPIDLADRILGVGKKVAPGTLVREQVVELAHKVALKFPPKVTSQRPGDSESTAK